jgi:ATP-binding cassette subfamily B (MDR/TAP) protein 9
MNGCPQWATGVTLLDAAAFLSGTVFLAGWPDLFWGFFVAEQVELTGIPLLINRVLVVFLAIFTLLCLFAAFAVDEFSSLRFMVLGIMLFTGGAFAIFACVGASEQSFYTLAAMLAVMGCALGLVLLNSSALMQLLYRSRNSQRTKDSRHLSSTPVGRRLSFITSGKAEPLLPPEFAHFAEEKEEEEDSLEPDAVTPLKPEVAADHAAGKPGQKGWTRLLQLAATQKKLLFVGCVALLIRLPFSLAVPHFVSEVLGAIYSGDKDQAWLNVFYLLVAGTVDSLLDFWNYFLFGFAQQKLIRGLRIDLFRAILKQEVGFFDITTTGELTSRLSSDTSEMANDLTWVFRFTIEALVRIGGITVYMFVREWRLALMACAVIPVCAGINRVYGNWLHKNAQKVQTALAEANSVAQESISCMRTVYSFANEGVELDRYVDKISVHYTLNVRQVFMQALYYMVVSTFLINTCVQAAILSYGAYLSFYQPQIGLSPQAMIAFMLYQGQLQEYCSNLFNSFTNLIKGSGAGSKVFELLDRSSAQARARTISQPSAICAKKITAADVKVKGDISVFNLYFSYPSRPKPVLQGVTFQVRAGEVVALVGSSGSGKSTVFHLIENFYQPEEGFVKLDGNRVSDYDHSYLHQVVGIVGQEPVLFSGTILSNITYSCAGSIMQNEHAEEDLMRRVEEAAAIANAHTFIKELPNGYNTEVGERGVQLSGGQKQRIAIARAILQDPRVLLLDEATSALDAESEAVVQGALDKAMKGRTTLVIAHRLSTVKKADRIVVMDKGQVVEMGSHADLMDPNRPDVLPGGVSYRLLVERQITRD